MCMCMCMCIFICLLCALLAQLVHLPCTAVVFCGPELSSLHNAVHIVVMFVWIVGVMEQVAYLSFNR